MITKILKSLYTIVIIAKISSSFTLYLTGIGLIATPISNGIACGLTFGNKVIYEIVMGKYKIYKKQYRKDQETIKSFDKLYRRFLQDKIFEKKESESLFNIFTKYRDETKNESFW